MTPAKVGFVVVASLMATVWMFGQVGQSLTGETDSFRVYAMLDDVSGLVTKSRVSIAGINVGQLDEVELVEGRARVWVRIAKRPDFVLKSDARIHKRQASLLGEYYLEITPGYLGDSLKDGDEIKNVGTDVSPAELMNDLRKISQDVVSITQSVKRVVGADGGEQKLIQIVDEFHKTASAIEQTVTRNSEKNSMSFWITLSPPPKQPDTFRKIFVPTLVLFWTMRKASLRRSDRLSGATRKRWRKALMA